MSVLSPIRNTDILQLSQERTDNVLLRITQIITSCFGSNRVAKCQLLFEKWIKYL